MLVGQFNLKGNNQLEEGEGEATGIWNMSGCTIEPKQKLGAKFALFKYLDFIFFIIQSFIYSFFSSWK